MASKKQAAFLAMIAKSKSPAKKAFGGKAEDTKCMAKGGEVDRKSTNTKNVNNSKSRQVERDRARFKDTPNSASKKMAEGTKSAGVKAASSEVLGSGSALRGAGRLMGRAAGPAALLLEPSELGDSDIKGGETKWSGFDDTSSDTTLAKPAEATVAVKKSEPKSMAAPVKKSSPRETSKGSRYNMADDWNKFSKAREADTAALKADTDRYNQTGTLAERSAEDTAELASLTDKDFKKGGMTKRPPARPTKKVPPRKFASGGTTRSSTSHRGDGCATKGHTKGRVR